MSDPHGNDELNSRIEEIHARQAIMEANIAHAMQTHDDNIEVTEVNEDKIKSSLNTLTRQLAALDAIMESLHDNDIAEQRQTKECVQNQVDTQGEMISQTILDVLKLAQRIDRVELKLKQQQQNGFNQDGPM